MQLDYDRLSRMSRDIALHTSLKTTNILDGNFTSLTRGKSLDFDDLREYVPGDDFHDIDWKSSSRADTLLIRRYVAEKKHNVLFVADTGAVMDADTISGDKKNELALLTFGTIAYILGRQGADIALMYSNEEGLKLSPFNSDTVHIEKLMRRYAESIFTPSLLSVSDMIDSAPEACHKRMIMIVITDILGLKNTDEKVLKRLTINNDLYFFCIEDAYLTGRKVYDTSVGFYEDRLVSSSRKLHNEEVKYREEIVKEFKDAARRSRVGFAMISDRRKLIDDIAGLFERSKNGIFG